MDTQRQTEVFRALIKDMARKKGLQFEHNDFLRELGQEAKAFNERHKLSTPLTKVELIELYLELMPELVEEHFVMAKAKLAELKAQSK